MTHSCSFLRGAGAADRKKWLFAQLCGARVDLILYKMTERDLLYSGDIK